MFQNNKLAVMAYAQCYTIFNYLSPDPLFIVEQLGYFNQIKHLCFAGDKIIVLSNFEYCEYVITSVEKDVVIKQLTPVIALANKPCELEPVATPQATPQAPQATPQPIKENLATIIAWHTETFPHATYDGQIKKFEEEMEEYLSANTQQDRLEELADLIIVCCGIARFSTTAGLRHIAQLPFNFTRQEIDDAVQAKMIKNRQRKWTKGDGQYRHVEN